MKKKGNEPRFIAKDFVQPVLRSSVRELGLKKSAEARSANRLVTGVPVSETWVEVPIDRNWIAAYRLLPQEGQPVIGELRIFPAESDRKFPGRWSAEILAGKAQAPKGGLTARLLRQVRVGEHLSFAGEFLSWYSKQFGEGVFEPKEALGRRGFAAPGNAQPPRRGRLGKSDLYYARIAEFYAERIRAGSRRPVADIAEQLRMPHSKARDMVHQARRRGFLSQAMWGKRGGALTEKAKRLLATHPKT